MNDIRLDRVLIFSDQLSFLIPHEWIEADEATDNYLYHAPNADSGWFRVSLLTLRDGNASRERIYELMTERARQQNGQLYEFGENIILAWERLSNEKGVPICNLWWAVAHSHGTNLGQEALFSYTVLRTRRGDQDVHDMVSLLGKLVADARFASPPIFV